MKCSLKLTYVLCRYVWAQADGTAPSVALELLENGVEETQSAVSKNDTDAPPSTDAASHATTNTASASQVTKHASHGAGVAGSIDQDVSTSHRAHFNSSLSTTPHRAPPHPTFPPSPEAPPHTVPRPPPPPPPHWHPAPPRHHSDGGMIIGIVFGVVGGLAAVFALFALGRCFHSWRRTPGADRIRTALDRHYLEAEMAEREREDIERRVHAMPWRRPRQPPPPPYQHAPEYESVAVGPSSSSPALHADMRSGDAPPLSSEATPPPSPSPSHGAPPHSARPLTVADHPPEPHTAVP